jgi:hypothetical protein
MNRLGAALFAVIVAGQVPGSAAAPAPEQQVTLPPSQKPPVSELFRVPEFRVPEPRTAVKPPQEFRVEPREFQGDVRTLAERTFTARIVCGMKMIEGTADLDPGIVKPIPERHGAMVRVLGPPPCADADSRRETAEAAITSGSFSVVFAPIPDRR